MKKFISVIKSVEVAMGSNRRILHQEELVKREEARRSLYLAQDVECGMTLDKVDVTFRRPGNGIAPDTYEKLKHYRFTRDMRKNEIVNISDLGSKL